ncbi:unnamed protein product [Pleuronectes platessa]|uniref:Uncharacterized protein n=1 Tax=Pleuronectes platessa TaxID=8262 RepID=A0A9N7TWE8_PLEPL|nr:unnamed protein product [Pleuronectes platessa]
MERVWEERLRSLVPVSGCCGRQQANKRRKWRIQRVQSRLHASLCGFPLCTGIFWCSFIDAAVMNDKSQTAMDFSRREKLEHERSVWKTQRSPSSTRGTLWFVSCDRELLTARGTAVLFGGHWPVR